MNPESLDDIAPDLTLEVDRETLASWVDAVFRRIADHLETLPDQPAGYDFENPPPLPDGLGGPLPERGAEFDGLLDLFFDAAVPHSFNTAGPGYLAYIPGGGLPESALASFMAEATNRFVGVWLAAPLVVQIELDVIRWLRDIVGFPATSRGLLTTGGSMSNFTAIVTARHELLGEEFGDGVLYASDQVHHCVLKAARIAGLPERGVVSIPTDDRLRMRTDELAAAIAKDRAAGKRPFFCVASAGTTNTGAVDDIRAVVDICRAEGVWSHVDAAYGGFFALTDTGREILSGMGDADSITLDPHKGLFIPYGTGALIVRDGEALHRTHSLDADYLPDLETEGDFRMDFCEHSLELSRGFRGLGVWLPFKLHGAAPFRRNLEEKLRLTRWAAAQLEDIAGVEVTAPPQLSVTAFRLLGGGDLDETNAMNRELLRRILGHGRVWLTPTMIRGAFVIRICVLSFRTHRDRMAECLDIIRTEVSRMREERGLA